MFNASVRSMFAQVGKDHNLDPAVLAAIAQTESGSIVTTPVAGHDEPLIRFEGHYFDKRLSTSEQTKARAFKLSSPKVGGIANPASQTGRWQLLERAAQINRDAAYESTVWGMGQVMGAHWHWLGYPSVQALVDAVRASPAGQIELMTRFLLLSNLRVAVNTHDWSKLAYVYNGPLYAKNQYDRKLAQAYALYQPLFPQFEIPIA